MKWSSFNFKNRRILVVLLSVVIISITAMPTFSYFTGTSEITSLNSSLNNLSIQNGVENFTVDFSSADMKRYSKDGTLLSEPKKNPDTGDYITYGPIWIKPNSSDNLSSKIDMLTEYTVKKSSGINENNKLKAKVSFTVTRCNSSGDIITGSEAFKITKNTTDADGNSFDIASMYTKAFQSINLDFSENWQYKIEYKIVLKSANDLNDTLNKFNIDFTVDSIKLKATQENNFMWGVSGTEDEYKDSIVESD